MTSTFRNREKEIYEFYITGASGKISVRVESKSVADAKQIFAQWIHDALAELIDETDVEESE